MRKVIFLIILCIGAELNALGWSKTFGEQYEDVGYSIAKTCDSGYIVAGWTHTSGISDDIYLIKMNEDGNCLFLKTYGHGGSDERAYSITQTNDGGYIVTGYTNYAGIGGNDVLLLKTDSLGDTLWTRTYGGINNDIGASVAQTKDGGYIITGIYVETLPNCEIYLVKTDSAGDTMWTKTFPVSTDCYGSSIIQTTDNGYAIAGYTLSPVSGYDVFLIKTDSAGDTMWTRIFGNANNDYGYSIIQASDTGLVIVGSSFNPMSGINVYLIKTNIKGDTMWTTNLGGASADMGYSVAETKDSGFIIGGYTSSYDAGNVLLLRTDCFGNEKWHRTFGGGAQESGYSVLQSNDNGYVISGYTKSIGAGNKDVYIVKTDSIGFIVGVQESNNPQIVNSKPQLVISQNPNPIIRLDLRLPIEKVGIAVFDLAGRLEETIYSGTLSAGNYTFTPNIKTAGIYFVRLDAGDYKETQKLVLMK